MLQTFKLLLPALIPSWRFFDEVAPAPRIEYRVMEDAQDAAQDWQEFRPRPAHVSLGTMFKRMVWNPEWNESLFLMSCAERLMQNPTDHSEQEILKHIQADLAHRATSVHALQFRLVFVARYDNELHQEITYISTVYYSQGSRA